MIDIEVTTDMKPGRGELSEGTITFHRYSVKDCHHFILRLVESKDECGTIDKCHAEALIQEGGFRVFLRPSRVKIVLGAGSESVAPAIPMVLFNYKR